MSAPYGDPAYNPNTFKLGYQMRQFGVAGPSALEAMATPPTALVTGADNPESTPAGPEPYPVEEH